MWRNPYFVTMLWYLILIFSVWKFIVKAYKSTKPHVFLSPYPASLQWHFLKIRSSPIPIRMNSVQWQYCAIVIGVLMKIYIDDVLSSLPVLLSPLPVLLSELVIYWTTVQMFAQTLDAKLVPRKGSVHLQNKRVFLDMKNFFNLGHCTRCFKINIIFPLPTKHILKIF